MMRRLLASLLGLCFATAAFAQGTFTGYPPVGYLFIGQGSSVAPAWVQPQGPVTFLPNGQERSSVFFLQGSLPMVQGGCQTRANSPGILFFTSVGCTIVPGTPFANQVLLSGQPGYQPGSAVPQWSVASFASTYPSYGLLYSNGPSNVQGLQSCANGLIATNAVGQPFCSAGAATSTFPNAVAVGDLVYWNGTAWARLPSNFGSGTGFLTENSSGVPSWTATGGPVNVQIAAGTGIAVSGTCNSSSGVNCTVGLATPIAPTTQSLTSGTSATYTTPPGAVWLEVFMVGGGGGGTGGSASSVVNGSNGGTSTFNSINAAGGLGANQYVGGAGGTGGTGTATRRAPGGPGGSGQDIQESVADTVGAAGGTSYFGGGGIGSQGNGANGVSSAANTGGGGGGASFTSNGVGGGGGGSGEFVYLIIGSPSANYTYTVGTSGAGGVSTNNGGAGGTGFIFVIEHYN